MASRYVYSYYLNDLIVNDRNHLLNMLDDLPEGSKSIVEDYKDNYQNVIGLYVSDLEEVEEELHWVRDKLNQYNDELDKYHVNKEMRFDVNDLPDAIGFHRLLFRFMPEKECVKALEARREKLKNKLKAEEHPTEAPAAPEKE